MDPVAAAVAGAVAELSELLRIRSVAGDQAALERAVAWVCSLVVRSGGTVERESWSGVPLGVGMIPASEPVLVLATRGIASMRVRVQVAANDVHSGLFGGVALNAALVLMDALAAVIGRDGELSPALRAGLAAPSPEELRSWAEIDVARMLITAGVPFTGGRMATLRRLWAAPAVDVHGLSAGITERELNIVPAAAEAILSVRVAPGQDVAAVGAAAEAPLRAAVPAGVKLSVMPGSASAPAGPFDPSGAAIAAARDALGRAFGTPTVLARSGGSLPILAALSARGIPTALSGLALPDSHIHGTDERLRVDHLELGIRAARELLLAWDTSVLGEAATGRSGHNEAGGRPDLMLRGRCAQPESLTQAPDRAA